MGSFVIYLYLLCYFNEKFEALIGRSSVQKKKKTRASYMVAGAAIFLARLEDASADTKMRAVGS
jgi:hypothetical protein